MSVTGWHGEGFALAPVVLRPQFSMGLPLSFFWILVNKSIIYHYIKSARFNSQEKNHYVRTMNCCSGLAPFSHLELSENCHNRDLQNLAFFLE